MRKKSSQKKRKEINMVADVPGGCQIKATAKASRCEKYEHCKHRSQCLDAAMRWPGFKCVNGHPGFEEKERQLEFFASDDDPFLWGDTVVS